MLMHAARATLLWNLLRFLCMSITNLSLVFPRNAALRPRHMCHSYPMIGDILSAEGASNAWSGVQCRGFLVQIGGKTDGGGGGGRRRPD